MLPRWHIVYGALFSAILWISVPQIEIKYLAIVFLASVFIDFDHYLCAVKNTGSWSLFHSFQYHKIQNKVLNILERKGKKPRSDFHLFHTVEFHALIGILGIWIAPFFYLFIGMAFHSFLDLFSLLKTEKIHRREYFFFNWLKR
ncbi:hypothetical protein J4461_03000 [Candidatus Pacearchaeota archaeon]|nr:hypothetical protein [Candidatus Pacearchaeota archaeon]